MKLYYGFLKQQVCFKRRVRKVLSGNKMAKFGTIHQESILPTLASIPKDNWATEGVAEDTTCTFALSKIKGKWHDLPGQGLCIWVEHFMAAGQTQKDSRRHLGTLSLSKPNWLFSAPPILCSRSILT